MSDSGSAVKDDDDDKRTKSDRNTHSEGLDKLKNRMKKQLKKGKKFAHDHMEEDTIDELKEKLIVMVNPRLKSFNKPVLLALTIGFITLVLTIILYVLMMANFKVMTFSGMARTVGDFIRLDEASCYYFITTMRNYDSEQPDPNNPDGPTIQFITFDPCQDFQRLADQEWSTQFQLMDAVPFEVKFCDLDPMPEGMTPGLPPTYGAFHQPGSGTECVPFDGDVVNLVVQLEYKLNPPPFTTLGAAFGYISFIELFVTACLLIILTKAGVIKQDEAFLKDLIDSILKKEEEEEIEIEAGQNKEESDELVVRGVQV